MEFRPMGSLGWDVSALGFGCMRLPRTRRLLFKRVDEAEAVRILRRGIERGVNYLDTAYVYHFGRGEAVVGQALRDGYRDRVKLVTKFPVFLARKPEDFEKILDRQLARLGTDRLDGYLLHSLNKNSFEKVKRFGLVDRLERARKAGKVLHVGFSFHDTFPVFREIVEFHPWDIVMVQHNYMDTAVQATSEGLALAHGKGMAVAVMEPLKGGMLANPPAAARALMDRSAVRRAPVDWALQFLWNKPEVSVVLSGMSSRDQVEQNCDSADRSGVGSLTPAELETLEGLADAFRERIVVGCTGCGYCMPCPQGVDIPDCFAILNNVALAAQGNFGQKLHTFLIRRRYKKLARSPKDHANNPRAGRAALCTRCGECIEKCPQGLDVPTELDKVHAVLGRGEKVDRL